MVVAPVGGIALPYQVEAKDLTAQLACSGKGSPQVLCAQRSPCSGMLCADCAHSGTCHIPVPLSQEEEDAVRCQGLLKVLAQTHTLVEMTDLENWLRLEMWSSW